MGWREGEKNVERSMGVTFLYFHRKDTRAPLHLYFGGSLSLIYAYAHAFRLTDRWTDGEGEAAED